MMLPPVELLVVNARPWSDGALLPGADAVAVAEGRVLAVGRGRDLEGVARRSTLRLDARGATVTPGITDSHVHLLEWARSRAQADLRGATSRAEALARLARFAAARPDHPVVVGRGWDAHLWSEPPARSALDGILGERPTLLHSKDFHALWVNSVALRLAGVTRSTPDPPGGRFERDRGGEPTGVVREQAVRAFAALEARSALAATELELARAAARELHARGVTAVHDFEGPAAQRTVRALTRDLGPRVRVLMGLAHEALDGVLAAGIESGVGDDWFRIGALKLFADGTLGSQTAALLAPYDGSDQCGMEQMSAAELSATVARAFAGGVSVAVHAIGDRACRHALDAIEAAPERAGLALPPRVEHAQLLDPADLPRFAQLGVTASMQPSHCPADLDLVEHFWGSRREHSYPWRSLLDSGASLAFGSDAPVEPPDVALGLHAAVTRRRRDGEPPEGFVPAQCLPLDAALRAYTEAPARLAGAWPRFGRLAAGAIADLVVWDADLHALDPARLHEARPVATVLDGRLVHAAGHAAGLQEPAAAPAAVTGAEAR